MLGRIREAFERWREQCQKRIAVRNADLAIYQRRHEEIVSGIIEEIKKSK